MEIVLQWLDELDDLVFAGFSIWSGLRRLSLGLATTAAVALHALPRIGLPIGAEFALAEISLASLAAWAILATLSSRSDLPGQSTAISS